MGGQELLLTLLSCEQEVSLDLALPAVEHGVERDPRAYIFARDEDPCSALRGERAPKEWGLLLVELTPEAISIWDGEGLREVQSLREGLVPDVRGALVPSVFDATQPWSEALRQQQDQCQTSAQDEVLLAVDPATPIELLLALQHTLAQAGFARQALWVLSSAATPDRPREAEDVSVWVSMLGTEVMVQHPQRGQDSGQEAGVLATHVLGEAPDCAFVAPFAGGASGDLVSVLDSLSGAGARFFIGLSSKLATQAVLAAATPRLKHCYDLGLQVAAESGASVPASPLRSSP